MTVLTHSPDQRRPAGGAPPGSASGGRPESPHGALYAALDLGTNNCRLLIARRRDEPGPAPGSVQPGIEVIDAFSRIVRLGEGLATTGSLSDAAQDRTLSALAVCAAKIRRHRPRAVRVVATEACRRALNGRDFLARVSAETGLSMETIDPSEEALLALAGCSALLRPDRPYAVMFDIGGGSTELIWLEQRPGRAPLVRGWTSLPLGVVSLAEGQPENQPASLSYAAMRATVEQHLDHFTAHDDICRAIRAGQVQMLGASGTVTTLAGIHLNLPRYDRARVDGITLSFDDLATVSQQVRQMEEGARHTHPCIGRARADLVVAGCAILDALCARWPVGSLRIADRGVREGILLGLMGVPVPTLTEGNLQ